MPTYGQNLRKERRAKGLNQEDVAKKLGLAKQGNLSAFENGSAVPEIETVFRHAQAIGCLPSELLKDVVTIYDRAKRGEFDDEFETAIKLPRVREILKEIQAKYGPPQRKSDKRSG